MTNFDYERERLVTEHEEALRVGRGLRSRLLAALREGDHESPVLDAATRDAYERLLAAVDRDLALRALTLANAS